MKLFKSILGALLLLTLTFVSACSDSGKFTPLFQNNIGSTDPSNTDILDPFIGNQNNPIISPDVMFDATTIANLFNPNQDLTLNMAASEYDVFVGWLSQIKENNRDAVIDVLQCAANLENKSGAYDLIAAMRDILGYVIEQDTYDTEPTGTYWEDLADYLNRINTANTGIKDDIYSVALKGMSGFLEPTVYNGNMEQALNDFRLLLSDAGPYTNPKVQDLIGDFEEGMGKLLVRSNDYITYSTKNTYLGNSVAGTDLVLLAVSNIAQNDADAKANLYNIFREAGKLLNTSEDGSNFTTIFKRLLMQLEDYYTEGGLVM
ncbi:MAG: hypothetical protein PHU53_03985, partial [Thermoplasmata archaeon]|nr:hypothetical protein [Thermoplasmata archaeon]